MKETKAGLKMFKYFAKRQPQYKIQDPDKTEYLISTSQQLSKVIDTSLSFTGTSHIPSSYARNLRVELILIYLSVKV